MSKLAIVAAILPAARWWTNRSLLRLQYLNRLRVRFVIPVSGSRMTRPS